PAAGRTAARLAFQKDVYPTFLSDTPQGPDDGREDLLGVVPAHVGRDGIVDGIGAVLPDRHHHLREQVRTEEIHGGAARRHSPRAARGPRPTRGATGPQTWAATIRKATPIGAILSGK